MKAAELRDLSDEELRGKLRELQEELFNLRFQLATDRLRMWAVSGRCGET
jgi:large subunit ribosomal protein L29